MIDPKDLHGTWRLADFRLVQADGSVDSPWEDDADGLLIYAADGHMSAAVVSSEKGTGLRTTMMYSGPFETTEDAVIHKIDFASQDPLVGTDQLRKVSFDGDTLILSSSPSIYGGEGTTAQIHWQRVSK